MSEQGDNSLRLKLVAKEPLKNILYVLANRAYGQLKGAVCKN